MRCRSYWRSEITHETVPWSSEEINRSFMKLYPGHQGKEIEACIAKVANFIESIQLPDSSWFVFSFEIKVWFGYGWFRVCVFCFFFFFFFSASCTVHGTWTVHLGLWTVTLTVYSRGLHCARNIVHCSRDSQPLYSGKNIKNGSHVTV